MKCYRNWLGWLWLIWLALLLSMNVHARTNSLPDFTNLVAEHSAAVVNISTSNKPKTLERGMSPHMPESIEDLFERFFGNPRDWGEPRGGQSLGSGFVLSSDGYILTNHHVVKDADEIIVRFSDKNELVAELLGSDERSDVALLKVDATDLKAVKIGNSAKMEVGEWVLAIGSPFGFDYSATAGIVSALGRSLPSDSYVPFIQTDVAINPGNSGGPLFNLAGEVIGINSQIYSRTGGFMGVSFAIPMDVVMNVVNQIKSQGYVSRGWLGVSIQNVTRELAESFGMDKPQGALISQVMADSPALKAGLEPGDIILKFNGEEVESSSSLPPMVGNAKINKKAPVVLLRNGKRKTIRVTIEQLPEDNDILSAGDHSGRYIDKRLDIEVVDLNERQLDRYRLSEGGALVVGLDRSGIAAAAGIRRGDVIVSIGKQNVESAKQFLDITKKLPENGRIPVLIRRGQSAIYLVLKMDNDN